MPRKLSLEAFEERLVPAAVVKFTEVDGDKITVRTNKGTTEDLESALGIPSGATDVVSINLHLSSMVDVFAGTNVKITASGPGNKLADNVGIVASERIGGGMSRGLDLGTVSVKGNLAYLDVGDGDLGTPAVKKLTVSNWLAGNVSYVVGDIGTVVVKGAFDGWISSVNFAGFVNYLDPDATTFGAFTCRTFGGEAGNNTGYLQVRGIGHLTIKESFTGDDAFVNNGLIQAVTIAKSSIVSWAGDARIEMG